MGVQRDLRGRRFSVIGAARSGLAVAGLLRSAGAMVFVSDRSPAEEMTEAVRVLKAMGAEAEFGANSARLLDAETIVISPGVPSEAPPVREALARKIPVVSELEVACWFCAAPIAAITGTNGKTTTTTLIGRMFSDARVPCVVAGNIGTAFSEVAMRAVPDGVAVLEVSSFQLDHIAEFRPRVAALLNITPDHLDRYHHSMQEYVASKQRVFSHQANGDVLIYNVDDDGARTAVEGHASPEVTLLPFSTRRALERGAWIAGERLIASVEGKRHDVIARDAISIPGEHNLANAMAATLVGLAFGVPAASLRATLNNFRGVEHRLEFVREVDGVAFVNDSKATNVDSVWYALRSFRRPLIVLIGGRDKGNDYSRLLAPVREHVRAVVAIGESADKVMKAFGPVVRTVRAASMQEAVDRARALAVAGDTVLLSPACASFDWFRDYEDRGRVFKDIVNTLRAAS